MTNNNTALAKGLCACQSCGLVSELGKTNETLKLTQKEVYCPRCRQPMLVRKRNSMSKSMAYLMTAYLLYIPANLLPIMDTSSLFNAQRDTIMSGVIFLWRTNAVSLAILVFLASIVTPLFKMLALSYLLYVVKYGVRQPLFATKLYRFLHMIGRWSMLDIFMVAILVTLVNVKTLTVIVASPGAIAFAGVVIFTMLAVESFDVRLLWDNQIKEAVPTKPDANAFT
jgi:paraquat-inducible protein A